MDTLANMLTSIRNANAKMKEKVEVPFSNLQENVAKILNEEGFISNYKIVSVQNGKKKTKRKIIRITLRYSENKTPVINGLKKVSKPGYRVYRSHDNIPKVRAAFGVTIISTSKGLLTNKNAKREKIGGEVLCQIW